MKRMFQKRNLITSGLVLANGLFFGLTNPAKVPSIILILGFLLFALSIYYLFRLLLTVFKLYGLPIKHNSKRLARLLSGITAGVLALQSIGELSFRDILVLLPLAVLMYLYLTYGQSHALN